ncbi:MAG: ImmA/IrrE family metallo-endopeptidase, partial [Acidobacteriota bacterium]
TTNRITEAPVPVDKISEKLGATLIYQPSDDDLSGFLLREKDKITIGVNGSHPPNRRRFAISHEIGHLLLHSEESFHIDRTSESFARRSVQGKFERNKDSSTGSYRIEREANLFAAELLMPTVFIEKDMTKLGRIDVLHDPRLDELADAYGVSLQALTYRLNNLGYTQV